MQIISSRRRQRCRPAKEAGSEFFTPTAIIQLIVGIIEPFHDSIFDPACGSWGMFVQSARFVTEHQKNPGAELSVYGQEKDMEKVKSTARELLNTLKAGELVLDWRKRQQARAEVRVTIEKILDYGLPMAYTPELFRSKNHRCVPACL